MRHRIIFDFVVKLYKMAAESDPLRIKKTLARKQRNTTPFVYTDAVRRLHGGHHDNCNHTKHMPMEE